jgi:hypothetical protein
MPGSGLEITATKHCHDQWVSGSLDPDYIRIQWGTWIRIRDSQSGFRRAKIKLKNINFFINFIF